MPWPCGRCSCTPWLGGWWVVLPAAVAPREDYERRPRSPSTHAPPRPVYLTASTVPSYGHSHRLYGKASRLGDAERHWGCTDAAAVDREWFSRGPSSGPRQSTELNPVSPPAAAPGMGSLNHIVERSGALVSCLTNGRKLFGVSAASWPWSRGTGWFTHR